MPMLHLLAASLLATAPPRVVFVVGEGEYRSEWSMPALAEILADSYGFDVDVLIDEELHGGEDNSIEDLDALEDADLAIFYMRFRQLPDDQLDILQDYVDSGRPIVAFRTTTHAFAYEEDDERAEHWNAFGARVLGAPWLYHYGHEARTDATIVAERAGHPILADIDPSFRVRSWTYHVRPDYPPASADVLVRGRPLLPGEGPGDDDTVNPIAWTDKHPGGGRVFMTTMGHPEDFQSNAFRRLIVNGVHWALGRDAPDRPVPSFPRFRPDTGQPWQDMDYGPFISAAIEVTRDNIANKGIAIPVGNNASMLFDTDLLRYAAGWPSDVQLRGIVYDGPHGIWPRIDGEADWVNPVAPGVSLDGNFVDDREHGFGPMSADVAQWNGLRLDDEGVVLSYDVGGLSVLERPGLFEHEGLRAYVREIEHDGTGDIQLQIARSSIDDPRVRQRGRVTIVGQGPGALGVGVISTARSGHRIETNGPDVRLHIDMSRKQRTRAKLLIARLERQEDVTRFVSLVDACPAPRELSGSKGHRARWSEKPVLAGELDVTFDHRDEADVVTRHAGDPAEVIDIDVEPGERPTFVGLDGSAIAASSAVATEAIVIRQPSSTAAPAPLAGWDCDEGEGAAMRNVVDGEADLALDGVTWRRGVTAGRSLDFDGTARARWMRGDDLEWHDNDLTVAAWIHTTKDGSIFSQTEPEGPWVADGKTMFIRNGVLCYDVGWVGVVTGETPVADGRWHHVAFTWNHESDDIVLYVDGQEDASGELPPREPVEGHVIRFGFTAENFPASPWFSGYIDGIRVFDRRLEADEIAAVASESGEPIVSAVGVRGAARDAAWRLAGDRVTLELPPATAEERVEIATWRGPLSRLDDFVGDLATTTTMAPFMIDRITWPDDNPYASWMRFGDFDFLDGGTAAAISTWSGDVWRVDGLDADLDELTWQRIATGLSQPLGVEVVDGEILVVGRDQITTLLDHDGDGEIDEYACYNHDTMNTEHFHEPCTGLSEGPDGSLYYLKAARHAKVARHPMHGTLVHVHPGGVRSEIVASGFRAPCGLYFDGDGVFFNSDQEGHWMGANRINRIVAGGFYGNNWSGTGTPRDEYDPPLCWVQTAVDRSPSAQLRVPEDAWGDLGGALLGVSYGRGTVYRLLEDEVDGVHQGGVVPLPIEVPTGLMTGHFNPSDGHLYVCGLFGWSSDQTEPGGFYRVRRSATPYPMPLHVRAVTDGLVIRFNEPVTLTEASFEVEAWNYRWTEQYGSPKLDLDTGRPGTTKLPVRSIRGSDDGRTVWLDIPTMRPAMQVHVDYELSFGAAGTADSFIHLTVHRLAAESGAARLSSSSR